MDNMLTLECSNYAVFGSVFNKILYRLQYSNYDLTIR